MKKHSFLVAVATLFAIAMAAESAPADGKGQPFGSPCAADADCASGACNKGKKRSFCSLRCSKDDECPTPPTAGACNERGYCKK